VGQVKRSGRAPAENPSTSSRALFDELCALLRQHAAGFVVTSEMEGSQATGNKPGLFLYTREPVSIKGRAPRRECAAGVILQKHFVGFYLTPMYLAPATFAVTLPGLKKAKKGKSCFNLKRLDAAERRELEELLRRGVAWFRRETDER